MATYNKIVAQNIKAARSRIGLSQRDAVSRMQALGFTAWHPPTLGNVERGERGLRIEELLGLALAFDTTMERLLTPLPEDEWVELPSGNSLPWQSVRFTASGPDPSGEAPERVERHRSFHRGIRWDGNSLVRVTSRYDDASPEGES
jgi:transcriptional regulator with XRE-family HTH domain